MSEKQNEKEIETSFADIVGVFVPIFAQRRFLIWVRVLGIASVFIANDNDHKNKYPKSAEIVFSCNQFVDSFAN